MSTTTSAPAEAPRYRIISGGEPDAATLAALVVALTPVAAPSVDEDGAATSAAPGPPAWLHAALLEGVGLGPFVAPSDLTVHPVSR